MENKEGRYGIERMLTVTVFGVPAPQGSKRYVGINKSGRGILVDASKKLQPWREMVKLAAIDAMGGAGKGIKGPIEMTATFTMPKPKSAPKRTVTYPDKAPDVDKLLRGVFDALTFAGAWEDDARVIRCHSSKVFPGEGPDSLPVPGVVIRISSALATPPSPPVDSQPSLEDSWLK